jgi:pilus assembly protein Flp/PilA
MREIEMNMISELAARFREEESGAAMVEYTILLGIITVSVIGLVAGVGLWVSQNWTDLCGKLKAGTGTGTTVAACAAQ